MRNCLFLTAISCILFAGCADSFTDEAAYQECNDTGDSYLCPLDTLCCKGECVTNSDENCGACGHACSQTEKCVLQATKTWLCSCAATNLPCSGTCCSTGCFTLENNINNCGGCGIACAQGQLCINGTCECPSDMQLCNNECIQTTRYFSDNKNCGRCGIQCPDATNPNLHLLYSQCNNGNCEAKCAKGYANSDGNLSNGCETSSVYCGNGILDPSEECDGSVPGDISCEAKFGPGYAGILTCNAECKIDSSGCTNTSGGNPIETQVCNNNVAEGSEICDGTDLKNATCSGLFGANYTGTPTCKSDCTGFENPGGCSIINTSTCGNSTLDNGEECDGSRFKDNKTTCQSYNAKYTTGNLKCSSTCTIDTSNCAECTENAVKCDGNFVSTCKNKSWSKASTACPNGCDNGKCKESGTVSTPTSINCKTLDGFTPAKGGSYTEINTKKLENGATVSIKANWVKSNGVYMNAESYIEVTGLKSVSQITIHYKSNAGANGYTVTAGAFSSSESNIASGATGDKTFTVTDSSANSFKIHSIKQKALIVESFSWE